MDPASPHGAAPTRRRHAAPAGPDDTGVGTAVVDAPDEYDGYDGRYGHAAGRTVAVPRTATSSTSGAPEPGLPTTATQAPAGLGGPDRRTPVRPTRTGRGRSNGASTARRIGAGILAGAFLMLTVASLDSFIGAQVPVLGSFAAPGGAAAGRAADAPPPAPPPPDTAGTCLNWSRPDAVDTTAVDCARPHLFEQAGNVKLADQPTFPTDQNWPKLVAQRCTPVVNGYLKNKFDPDGKFRIGALKPSQKRWDEGDRGMRCGLQSASRSGTMFPIKGKVAGQDQSGVVPVGTCLGIDGRTIGDPVSNCSQPHSVETAGVIDLGQQFKDEMPSTSDQDEYLQPACQQASNAYAGNDKAIAQKKLTVYWDNLSEASWKAGSRKVNCNLATLLPDSSGFASLTGSVKGPMSVGDQPAPATGGAPSAAPGSTAPSTEAGDSAEPTPEGSPQSDEGSPGGPVTPAAPPPSAETPDNPLGLPGLAP